MSNASHQPDQPRFIRSPALGAGPWGRALAWHRYAADLAPALPLHLVADLGALLATREPLPVGSDAYAAFLRAAAVTPAVRAARLIGLRDPATVAALAYLARGAPTLADDATSETLDLDRRLAPLYAHLLDRLRALAAADIHFLHALGPDALAAADLADLRAMVELLELPPLAHDLFGEALAFLPALAETGSAVASQLYATDGVGGLARHGSLDMALPGEWALPDDLLAYRFLNGELLYYGRERPPEQRRTLVLLLVQGGDAMAGDADLLARAAALALARAAEARGATPRVAWFDTILHPPQGLSRPREIAAFIQQQSRGGVDLPRVLDAALAHVRSQSADYARIEVQWLVHTQLGADQRGAVAVRARRLRSQAGSSALFLCAGATPTAPPLADMLAQRWVALGSNALHDAQEQKAAIQALRKLAQPEERETTPGGAYHASIT